MIIDCHAHIYPDKIAERASASISQFYKMPVRYDGKLSSLLSAGDAAGVGHFVVCSVATIPGQVASINAFLAAAAAGDPARLTGLGTLHPRSETLDADVDNILSLGLRGVKLHPDFQEFDIDGAEGMRVFERLEGRLPVLLHCGDVRSNRSHPSRLSKVLKAFPRLTLTAAHFGGWSIWHEASSILCDTGIYVDTSSSLYALDPADTKELIRCFTPERVIFGSDYPMWDHGDELAMLDKVGLSAPERQLVLGDNARRLYGIG